MQKGQAKPVLTDEVDAMWAGLPGLLPDRPIRDQTLQMSCPYSIRLDAGPHDSTYERVAKSHATVEL